MVRERSAMRMAASCESSQCARLAQAACCAPAASGPAQGRSGSRRCSSKCRCVDEWQHEGLVKVRREDLSFCLVMGSCREPSSLRGGSRAWEASNLCRISYHAGMQHVVTETVRILGVRRCRSRGAWSRPPARGAARRAAGLPSTRVVLQSTRHSVHTTFIIHFEM